MANKVSDSVAVPGKQSRNERIEEFLREHYAFRYNTVKSRAEFRSSDGEFLPVTKYRLNSFRRELDRTIGISTSAENLRSMLESDFSERVNPVQAYFHKLPPVTGDGSAVGQSVMKVLYGTAKKIPTIEIRPLNQVTELLTKDGKISGVKVETKGKDKKDYTIDAKAVVLATGGFGANAKLISSLRPEYKGFATTNQPGALGEGLDLAKGVGATFVDLREIQAHPTVVPVKGILISESMRARGGYLVNNEGNRFVNELQPRDVVAAAVLAQPTGKAWLLIDDKLVKSNKLAAGYVSQGLMVSGKNVDELAKAMGVPAKNLKATMDQYQKAFETKKDEAFGRPEMVVANNVWPMYAVQITPAIHHTMGGVRINKNAEVIGVTAKPIPGLYAAGEVTGGVHGGNRIGGNAVADIITFGRIAGANAANYMTK